MCHVHKLTRDNSRETTVKYNNQNCTTLFHSHWLYQYIRTSKLPTKIIDLFNINYPLLLSNGINGCKQSITFQ